MSEKSKRKNIHTTISEESYEILTNYADSVDDNGNKIFGNQSKVIEKALELLDKHYNPEKNSLQEIWNSETFEAFRKCFNKPKEICNSCDFYSICNGGCPLFIKCLELY